jgi:hypothetical protein
MLHGKVCVIGAMGADLLWFLLKKGGIAEVIFDWLLGLHVCVVDLDRGIRLCNDDFLCKS